MCPSRPSSPIAACEVHISSLKSFTFFVDYFCSSLDSEIKIILDGGLGVGVAGGRLVWWP